MSKAISERHEIVVETDESTFILTADSRDGRLVIEQRRKRGAGKGQEVCSLSLANPDELEAFFDGLRRVLSSPGLAPVARENAERPAGSRPSSSRAALPGSRDAQRDEVVARARGRNPKAFEPWSRAEEEEVHRRYQAGESIETIARAHNRSPKAIQMRLERLGALPPSGA
jgi:hypothetical protein